MIRQWAHGRYTVAYRAESKVLLDQAADAANALKGKVTFAFSQETDYEQEMKDYGKGPRRDQRACPPRPTPPHRLLCIGTVGAASAAASSAPRLLGYSVAAVAAAAAALAIPGARPDMHTPPRPTHCHCRAGLSNLDRDLKVAFLYNDKTFAIDDDADIVEFINDAMAGNAPEYIKSAPKPKSNNGPVKVVVGTTFDEIVNDPENDVLIEFYAPWCGHCKSLEPKWKKLGKKLKKSKGIVIAKMDATANHVPKTYKVEGFPTIYLALKDDKANPVVFEGGQCCPPARPGTPIDGGAHTNHTSLCHSPSCKPPWLATYTWRPARLLPVVTLPRPRVQGLYEVPARKVVRRPAARPQEEEGQEGRGKRRAVNSRGEEGQEGRV